MTIPPPDTQIAPYVAATRAYGRLLDGWLGRETPPPPAGLGPMGWARRHAPELHEAAVRYGERLNSIGCGGYTHGRLLALAVREVADDRPAWLDEAARARHLERIAFRALAGHRMVGHGLHLLLAHRGGFTRTTVRALFERLVGPEEVDDTFRHRAGHLLSMSVDPLTTDEVLRLLEACSDDRATRRNLLDVLVDREASTAEQLARAAELCTDYRERQQLVDDGRVLAVEEGRSLLGQSRGRDVLAALLLTAEGQELAGFLRRALRHHPDVVLEAARERPGVIGRALEAEAVRSLLGSEVREERETAVRLLGHLESEAPETPDAPEGRVR